MCSDDCLPISGATNLRLSAHKHTHTHFVSYTPHYALGVLGISFSRLLSGVRGFKEPHRFASSCRRARRKTIIIIVGVVGASSVGLPNRTRVCARASIQCIAYRVGIVYARGTVIGCALQYYAMRSQINHTHTHKHILHTS